MNEAKREVAPDIASPAALVGEPGRAAMLWSLVGGQLRPAGELARIAGISPQSASGHLTRLLDGGLLAVERRGRNRFYRLSGPEAASVIESLAALAAGVPNGARVVSLVPRALREARSCWGHLAGTAGVNLHDGLVAGGWLATEGDRYGLTADGRRGLERLGVDLSSLKRGRRGLAFPCLDWSERRPHVGGPLARALLAALVARGWFSPCVSGRQLEITPTGRERLRDLLEDLAAPAAAVAI